MSNFGECNAQGVAVRGEWRFNRASSVSAEARCDLQPGHGGDMHSGLDGERRVWWLRGEAVPLPPLEEQPKNERRR